MDLWTSARVVLKRWRLALPIALLCAGIGVLVLTRATTTYRSNAALLVLTPSAQATADGNVNPYLQFGGSQQVTASVLLTRMNSDPVRQRIAELGVTGPWTLGLDLSGAPVISLTVEEPTSAATLASAQTILDQTIAELHGLQSEAGAPEALFLHLSVLSPPTTPQPVAGDRARVLGAFGALGAILAVGAALTAEVISRERAKRRALRTAEDGTPTSAGDRVRQDGATVHRRLQVRTRTRASLPQVVGDIKPAP